MTKRTRAWPILCRLADCAKRITTPTLLHDKNRGASQSESAVVRAVISSAIATGRSNDRRSTERTDLTPVFGRWHGSGQKRCHSDSSVGFGREPSATSTEARPGEKPRSPTVAISIRLIGRPIRTGRLGAVAVDDELEPSGGTNHRLICIRRSSCQVHDHVPWTAGGEGHRTAIFVGRRQRVSGARTRSDRRQDPGIALVKADRRRVLRPRGDGGKGPPSPRQRRREQDRAENRERDPRTNTFQPVASLLPSSPAATQPLDFGTQWISTTYLAISDRALRRRLLAFWRVRDPLIIQFQAVKRVNIRWCRQLSSLVMPADLNSATGATACFRSRQRNGVALSHGQGRGRSSRIRMRSSHRPTSLRSEQ